MTYAMWRRIGEIYRDIGQRLDVRVAVLRGADISEFESRRSEPSAAQEYHQTTMAAVKAIQASRSPKTLALSHISCRPHPLNAYQRVPILMLRGTDALRSEHSGRGMSNPL